MKSDRTSAPLRKSLDSLSQLYGEWLYIRGVCVKHLLEHDEEGATAWIARQREIELRLTSSVAGDAREVAYKIEVLRDMLSIESINRDALQMLTSIEADLKDL